MPSVCAVMVTGKDPARFELAERSMQSFLEQTHLDKQLLIINDGPEPFLRSPRRLQGVVEYWMQPDEAPRLSLGELRNKALELLRAGSPVKTPDLVVQWDDDDFSHPNRITHQVSKKRPRHAVIFRYEVHCNLATGEAFVNCGDTQRAGGFPGTIMHSLLEDHAYPPFGKSEDAEFALLWKRQHKLTIVNNSPTLYLRFYHGKNTWHEEHVMKPRQGSRELTIQERAYVDEVRKRYTLSW